MGTLTLEFARAPGHSVPPLRLAELTVPRTLNPHQRSGSPRREGAETTTDSLPILSARSCASSIAVSDDSRVSPIPQQSEEEETLI